MVLIGAAFGSGLLMLPTATFSQQYPSKLVRLVIPYPAGGPTDTVGRLLAQRLSEQTGRTFLIDNAPGANGAIGADKVAKSKPTATRCCSMLQSLRPRLWSRK